MRYNTTEITEHYAWPLTSITITSELGSKELTEADGPYISKFVVVLGEDSNGVKLASGGLSHYIFIPESHPLYNSNIILQTFKNDQSRRATIYAATDFIRNELKDLLVSLKQQLGVS